ncbi:MAG: translocation/assembly module TamB domain-containing protein [Thermoanaerobaculia bacterium]
MAHWLRRWIVRPFFWALAAVAAAIAGLVLLGRSDWARERLRVAAVARLSEALGRPVAIGRADFGLIPFELELESVSVPGAHAGSPPLLRLRRLRIEGDLKGLRRPRLHLHEVVVDGLEVAIGIDAEGRDDLPVIPASAAGGGGVSLDLDSLTVRDGLFRFADAQVPLDLTAHGIAAHLAGAGAGAVGDLTVDGVDLRLPKARPYTAAVSGRLLLERDHLRFEKLKVRGEDLEGELEGAVRWDKKLVVELRGHVASSGALVDRLGYLAGEVAGPIAFEGGFTWRKEAWGWRGRVTSPGVRLFGFGLDDLEGVVSGEARTLRLDLEHARYAGGPVHGSFTVNLARGGFPSTLEVFPQAAAVDRVLADLRVPVHGLAAAASGRFRYDFRLLDATAGSGGGELSLLPETSAPGLPVAGEARVSIAEGDIRLERIELDGAGQHVEIDGDYSLPRASGRIAVAARSEEVLSLVRLLPFYRREEPELWLPLAGHGQVEATIALGTGPVRVDLGLDLDDVEAPGLSAGRVSGTLTVSEAAVEALHLRATRAGGEVALDGSLPLAARDPTPLDLTIVARAWPLAAARPWISFALPADGPASGTLRLTGALDALTGDLELAVAPATVAGIALDRLEVAAQFDPAAIRVRSASARAAAGMVSASGRIRQPEGALELELRADDLDLAGAPFSGFWGSTIAGRLAATATISGTLSRPAIELAGRATDLALAGHPLGGEPAPLALEWDGERATLSASIPGLLELSGGGPASATATALDLDLRLPDLGRWAPLVAGRPIAGAAGALAGRIAVRREPGRPLGFDFRSTAFELALAGHHLTAREPITLALGGEGSAADRLRISSLYLGEVGTNDELFVNGALGLAADWPLDLRLEGAADVAWLRPWAADLDLAGRLEALATVRGTISRPAVNGVGQLAGGRLLIPRFPHSLERVAGVVLFYPDALVVDRLGADFGGGTIAVSGRVDLPDPDQELAYRFQGALRDVTLRYPEGWLLRGDGDLGLASLAEGRQVRGELRLDRMYYLQNLDVDPAQLLRRVLTRTRLEVVDADSALATTYLDVKLGAPNAFRVRDNLADLRGSADLVLRGTLAQPALFGRVVAERGGTVDYGGNHYTIERAEVNFANPTRIEPLLDVSARAKVNEYDVLLTLSGPLERLNTSFTSDPPLPDLDILGLLATGQVAAGTATTNSSEAGAAPGGATTMAAESLLFGQAASLVGARVNKLFGFDRLRIDPLTTGDTVSALRVTVGKRLSRKLYVTYSYDPSSTAQQILEVEWRISDQLVLVLTQNGNESYSVDARWDARY